MASPTSASNRSTLQAAKTRIQGVKKKVNAALGKFGDAAIRVLDIDAVISTNTSALDALAASVADVTEHVLSKVSEIPEIETFCGDDLHQLQSTIEDIGAFLEEQEHAADSTSPARRADEEEHVQRRVTDLSRRLDRLKMAISLKLAATAHARLNLGEYRAAAQDSTVPSPPLSVDNFTTLRLPPNPQIFCGRDQIVAEMKTYVLAKNAARLALLGPPGIGKTSVAAAILHNPDVASSFGNRRIFISCDTITSGSGIVSALVSALNITAAAHDDLCQILVQQLGGVDGQILLILDNFETTWDSDDLDGVEEVLSHLDGIGNLHLILTIRGTTRPGRVKWSQPVLPPLGMVDSTTAEKIYLP